MTSKNKYFGVIIAILLITSFAVGLNQLTAADNSLETNQVPETRDEYIELVFESASRGASDKIRISTLNEGIVSPRDAASGLPTGKRQHKPLTITKSVDKATPILYQALVNNENMDSVTFRFYNTGSDGSTTNYYTIKLENAQITSIQHVSYEGDNGRLVQSEHISFVYQKIIWTWEDGGITAEDDWETPIA